MKSKPSKSGGQTPTNQVTTQRHYRRRTTHVNVFSNPVGRNTEAVLQSSQVDDQHHTPTAASGTEDLKPESKGERVSDPNGIKPRDGDHLPEDEQEIDPNKEIPEEDNYLEDEDGSIIQEPTREVDDPYRRGHGTTVPPTEEEFPKSDPKENIETDF
jgi:hypothetical protein